MSLSSGRETGSSVDLAESRVGAFKWLVRANSFRAHEKYPRASNLWVYAVLLGALLRRDLWQEPGQDERHRAGNPQPVEFGKFNRGVEV